MNEQTIIFYGRISDFSAASFIKNLDMAKAMRMNVREKMNSEGGDVTSGWGTVVAFREFPYKKGIDVHGMAASMAVVKLLYTEDTTAVQQSKFILHRAGHPSENFNSTVTTLVNSMNEDIKKAYEEKLNIPAFMEYVKDQTSYKTLEDFFDVTKEREDVVLNAYEAEQIGLIKNVITLNANEISNINSDLQSNGVSVAAQLDPGKKEVMKKEELKKNHPDLYKEIYEDGKAEGKKASASAEPEPTPKPEENSFEAGVQAEQERVTEWNVFADVDPEGVKAGIASGKPMTNAQRTEFLSKQAQASFANSGAEHSKTQGGKGGNGEGEGGKETYNAEEFDKAVDAGLQSAGVIPSKVS